jgi:nucleotide-binding universal stress UspA family protein
MYSHILVTVAPDHEGRGEAALSAADALLDEDGRITLINVHEPIAAYGAAYVPHEVFEKNRAEMKKVLDDLAKGSASNVETVVVNGNAGRAIKEYADDHKVDCIVIASHHPGIADYFLGSTAAWVARHADCSVHIIR